MKNETVVKVVKAADGLSLGISVVVSVLIGTGLGFWCMKSFGSVWFLVGGVLLGVASAINCVYKAYKAQVASYEEFSKDPKNAPKPLFDDEKDEE